MTWHTKKVMVYKGYRKFIRLFGSLAAVWLVMLLATSVAFGQKLDRYISNVGGRERLVRPSGMAVSASGEQIAICDPQINRIVVIDFQGRPLWTVGDQVALEQPQALCFVTESELLFTRRNSLQILKVSRDNPTSLDTVTDLTAILGPDRSLDQIIRTERNTYLILDGKQGALLHFKGAWKYSGVLVPNGSGKGKVLAPTSVVYVNANRLVVADRKNYPAQAFSSEGKFLFYFGWNHPAEPRGWEAVAAAVDSREILWVADYTNARFRLYDQAGTELSTLSFAHRLFRPIAMVGTIDNRMLVLDENGALLFYTLE